MKNMNLPSCFCFNFVLKLTVLVHIFRGVYGTTFTFTNKCDNTIWPGILSNTGSPKLDSTGFELPPATSRSIQAPSGWSGRFWARTGCTLSTSNLFYCTTADCGSGTVECSGAGAEPPATLAEFTLGTTGDDFYDVSLVDGYNLPVLVEPTGGSGQCAATGCLVDLNRLCPTELKAGDGGACKSACEAFGTAEYCCSGAYGTPESCRPTVYSEMFKSACPRSYSYAYDDATSTFTCSAADYTLTFCPSSPSQKSSTPTQVTPPMTTTTTTPPPDFTRSDPTPSTSTPGFGSGSGLDMTYGSATDGVPSTYTTPGTETDTGSGTTTTAMLSDGSWLAGLAMGDSTTSRPAQMLTVLSSILAIVLTIVLL
ncbi:hypothetical protein RND81_11G151900 [Saponaria officinalis]|uniref:Thaumatin-like protein 1 n=1 Tax=Saponaria officinalis TaxID=3572 RepID=A0AAW1HNE7_SAPOF